MLSTQKEIAVKKIAVFNLNVGSAIEYAGEIFTEWLREFVYEVRVYTAQTQATQTMRFLVNYEPDLIIINEDHHRPIVTNLLYQAIRHVPIIYIDHSWYRINWETQKNYTSDSDQVYLMWYKEMLHKADHIFCLNYKPDNVPWYQPVQDKISNRFYPTDPSIFNITQPWARRERMFCYIGNLLPHKLSEDFLAKIRWTDLKVDCFGSADHATERYIKVFDKAVDSGHISYQGLVGQGEVADVMNKYKYLVLPHDGYEPFNWVLKQCMFCGTIPLVTNDRDSTLYYGKWIDWADGLYMGTKYTNDFIDNMMLLVHEEPDHSEESVRISRMAQAKFDYNDFKNEFKLKAWELLHG
jgi:glycosyltransferase involved in cell wall biosynthesis